MKRIVCFLLVFVLAFSFTACGKDKDNKKENAVDIEYYAKLGKIPECDVAIGKDIEELKDELSKEAADDHEAFYDIQEGDKTVLIHDGKHNFYYVKGKEKDGISYIVSYEDAFGFEIGEISVTVKEALGEIEFAEEKLSQDNAFFVFGAQNGSVIKCEIEKYTVMFVFDDNALCATAIYVTKDW